MARIRPGPYTPPMIRVVAAAPGAPSREESAERIRALAASPDYVWVDLQNPTPEEVRGIAETLGFHPLAVEDTLAHVNHPKVDDYREYVYLVVHGIARDEKRGELETAELDCFLGRKYVVTVHDGTMSNLEEMRKRCLQTDGALGRGPDWLLHSILDRLTDTFLDRIDRFDEELDDLERRLFHTRHSPPRRMLAEIFAIRKDILKLKRVVHPARDVYGRIARGEYAVVRPEVAPHFRDVYDHVVRVADMLESFRDVLTSAVETHLSVVSQRTNEIMKVLTVISAILMTTGLLAGIYGMNFEALPGKSQPGGFWWMIGLMAAVSGLMVLLFKRQRWL